MRFNTQEGHIVVTDGFNHRVQIFTKFGQFLRKFGQLGSDSVSLEGPTGVALDENGYIYVADTNNQRIQVYDQMGGEFCKQIRYDCEACVDLW